MEEKKVYVWGEIGEILTIKSFAEQCMKKKLEAELIKVEELSELSPCDFLIIALHGRKLEAKDFYSVYKRVKNILFFSISGFSPSFINFMAVNFENISIVGNPQNISDMEHFIEAFAENKRYFSSDVIEAVNDKELTERSRLFSSRDFKYDYLKCCSMLLKGYKKIEVAEYFKVSRTSVGRWIEKIKKEINVSSDEELLGYLRAVPDMDVLLDLCAEEKRLL